MATTTHAYDLEGQLLEVCSCNVLCPCWIGEDPDGGTCDTFVAWHIDRGTAKGLDVSGLTVLRISQMPGNTLKGNGRSVIYIDGSPEQAEALTDEVFTGKLGGPLGDLAKLYSETLAIRNAPIEYAIREGKGHIRVGEVLIGEMAPYHGPDGSPTKLVDSIFSTIPGSPAYVAKASANRVRLPEFEMVWEYSGRNAIQGVFHLQG